MTALHVSFKIGSVGLKSDLRTVAAHVISSHSVFPTILSNELMKTSSPAIKPSTVDRSQEAIAEAVDNLSSEALMPESAGNKYHLLALSIATKRPIYIYKSCQDPQGLYYYMRKGVSELSRVFRDGGEGTQQHMR